jgi:hypothetical protein
MDRTRKTHEKKKRNAYKIFVGKPQNHSESWAYMRLKMWILEKKDLKVRAGSADSRLGSMEGFCEKLQSPPPK